MLRRLLALCCLLAVVGCQGAASSAPEKGGPSAAKKYRIAVIPKGTSHEFWKSVHAGAEQAAKEAGNVEILWKGPLLENDLEGQISLVEDFITRRVDGICLAPLDSQALVGPVKNAQAEGIPTVIFDSALDDESIIAGYVATDNYRGGELAARQLAEALNGKGNVILLRYNQGSESTLQREEAFLDELKKEYPDINVLSSDQYAGATPESALGVAQQLMLKHRDDLDGIFAVCESSGAGVLGALKNEGLAGKVKFVTFDPNAQLIAAMRDGQVSSIVLQDPVKMGYLAVKTMVDHLEGEPVENRISTGEFAATPENMKDPEMDKLLHPEQFEGS